MKTEKTCSTSGRIDSHLCLLEPSCMNHNKQNMKGNDILMPCCSVSELSGSKRPIDSWRPFPTPSQDEIQLSNRLPRLMSPQTTPVLSPIANPCEYENPGWTALTSGEGSCRRKSPPITTSESEARPHQPIFPD